MNTRLLAGMTVVAGVAIASTAFASQDAGAILERQTQALMDAVSNGDARVWQQLLDEQVVITDETGAVAGKAESVKQVVPLPKNVSGTITVTAWHATVDGPVAIATFVDDEHENYHGQHLHALYRATATWISRSGGWKLLAMQVMALQQDPPAVVLPTKVMDEYVGSYYGGRDLTYTITRSGNQLMGSSNGGKPVALEAELTDVLFAAGQPRTRKIVVRDGAGHVTGILSRREERDVVFKRIR